MGKMNGYDDIKKRLSPLNEITMSAETEQKIKNAIHYAAQAYRDGKRAPVRVKGLNWIGSVSAMAAAVVAAAGMVIVLHTRASERAANTSAAMNHTARNTTGIDSTAPIQYTPAQLTNVGVVAKDVGVSAWIPSRGLPGDTLTVVKNGGNQLILDYHHIWLIESNQAIANPAGITHRQSVDVGRHSGTFMVAGNNTFLDFREGTTYIQIENLTPDEPISLTDMKNTAESFRPIR